MNRKTRKYISVKHINSFMNPDQREEEVNEKLFLHIFKVFIALWSREWAWFSYLSLAVPGHPNENPFFFTSSEPNVGARSNRLEWNGNRMFLRIRTLFFQFRKYLTGIKRFCSKSQHFRRRRAKSYKNIYCYVLFFRLSFKTGWISIFNQRFFDFIHKFIFDHICLAPWLKRRRTFSQSRPGQTRWRTRSGDRRRFKIPT